MRNIKHLVFPSNIRGKEVFRINLFGRGAVDKDGLVYLLDRLLYETRVLMAAVNEIYAYLGIPEENRRVPPPPPPPPPAGPDEYEYRG